MSQPIFEVATIPLTVAALHRLPFSFVLYIFAVLTALGGATYALANSVWIAFVGRGLIGSGVSFGASTLHTYLGEMGTVMDDIREKQGKNPRKYVLYIALSFTINGGTVIPTSELCRTHEDQSRCEANCIYVPMCAWYIMHFIHYVLSYRVVVYRVAQSHA